MELSHFNELVVAVIGIDERGLVLIRLVVVEIYRDLAVGKRHDIEENITSDYRRGEHTDDEHTEYDQQSYPAGFFIRLFILLFGRFFGCSHLFRCVCGAVCHPCASFTLQSS